MVIVAGKFEEKEALGYLQKYFEPFQTPTFR